MLSSGSRRIARHGRARGKPAGAGADVAGLDRLPFECAGGRVTDCRVLGLLGAHELCRADHGHSEEGGREASGA